MPIEQLLFIAGLTLAMAVVQVLRKLLTEHSNLSFYFMRLAGLQFDVGNMGQDFVAAWV